MPPKARRVKQAPVRVSGCLFVYTNFVSKAPIEGDPTESHPGPSTAQATTSTMDLAVEAGASTDVGKGRAAASTQAGSKARLGKRKAQAEKAMDVSRTLLPDCFETHNSIAN